MKPNWTLRQILAILRGVALMVAVLWTLILLQLVPALLRGGLAGLRDHIVHVATAGVPPEHWGIAVSRMYIALAAIAFLGCALFLAQRYLARKLGSYGGASGRAMTSR
jgi:hypothetical protein